MWAEMNGLSHAFIARNMGFTRIKDGSSAAKSLLGVLLSPASAAIAATVIINPGLYAHADSAVCLPRTEVRSVSLNT